MDPGSAFVVGIDPATGAQKFSVPVPNGGIVESLIIAGDGYAYLTYGWGTPSSPPLVTYHLGLMRVNSSGTSDNLEVYSSPRKC